MHFDRVVIVGVGLLGGSIGLAMRKRKLATAVIGVGRNTIKLQEAQRLGAISEFESDVTAACTGADLAIICTPVQQVAGYVQQCIPHLRAGGLVTDVGSTKRTICEQLASQQTVFCGSHPLAGSDKSGVAYAEADLFEGRLTVLTPENTTPAEVVERTEALWQALGSRTARMTPTAHDEAIARISHLPHLVAAVLAGATPDALLPLAASGWCDTTRVASGNVELWRQIICENRTPVLGALRDFADSFQTMVRALELDNEIELIHQLQLGKQKRDSVGN